MGLDEKEILAVSGRCRYHRLLSAPLFRSIIATGDIKAESQTSRSERPSELEV